MSVSLSASISRAIAFSIVLLAFTGNACSGDLAVRSGQCTRDPAVDCSVAFAGAPTANVGLVGYTCSGERRPDEDARYVQGVPEGLVCANRGAAGATQSYCCSPETTPCAYNPVASCDVPGSYGYQCRGSSRPEALNAAITCGNGIETAEYIDYCCSGERQTPGCVQLDSVGCEERLTGFACTGDSLPKGEQLGSNQSRANYYRLLCPMPALSPSGKLNNYCCFMSALIPAGGSCVQDVHVPGCVPGRFGFACYGPDTPDQDYPPMHCPDPGFSGTSDEGYPATLHCCDFE